MIAGHFGFAAIVKSRERTAPLWGLMLATVWLDIVFIPLLLLHIETFVPLTQPPHYGGAIIHADYTHSIVGMILISALLGVLFLPCWGKRVAVIIGLVSASHWLLDLLVHRADMPILPANAGKLPLSGFGLWQRPSIAASLELLLVLAGAILYYRAAREVSLASGTSTKWASISATLIAIFGLLVLYMDFTA
jgi:hypothetical protein